MTELAEFRQYEGTLFSQDAQSSSKVSNRIRENGLRSNIIIEVIL